MFDPRIEAAHNEELSIARELHAAAAKRQLELFFQPKIDARKLEVTAVEALLRWRHPAMGLVSPARFIPIAERQGLMESLGQWVLDGTLKQAAAWHGAGVRFRVAVNVSGVQFRQDDFVAKLERGLQEPAWPLVLALARALGVTCQDFVGEATAAPTPPPTCSPGENAKSIQRRRGPARKPPRLALHPRKKR